MVQKIAILMMVATALAGCGNSSSGDQHDQVEQQLVGDVAENYSQVVSDKNATGCDRQNTALRLKIAREIDARKTLIDQAAYEQLTHLPVGSSASTVGPEMFVFVGDTKPVDEWKVETESWEMIEALYAKLDASSPPSKWLGLNQKLRSILMMDRNRVIHHVGYAIHREDETLVLAAVTEAERCNADSTCSSLTLTNESRQLMMKDDVYAYHLAILNSSYTVAIKRNSIAKLAKYLREDMEHKFTGWTSTAVVKTGDHDFKVRLNPGPFAEVAPAVSTIIEKTWQMGLDHVFVEWQPNALADAYSFLIDLPLGTRAFVSTSERKMHLSPITRTGTLVHEFGHILGLPDQYYEVWDAPTCSYKVESNYANLMSDSYDGQPQPQHFDLLHTIYKASTDVIAS